MDNFDDMIAEISSIKDSISNLLKEQRITNVLLHSLVVSRSQKYILPNNLRRNSQQSFTVVHDHYDAVLNMVLDIARRDSKKFCDFDGDSEGDLYALITSLEDGAYIVINNEKLITSPEIKRIIIDTYKNRKISITIGNGPGAREVKLDTPRINFVVFSDVVELVSPDIIEIFPVVNDIKCNLEANM